MIIYHHGLHISQHWTICFHTGPQHSALLWLSGRSLLSIALVSLSVLRKYSFTELGVSHSSVILSLRLCLLGLFHVLFPEVGLHYRCQEMSSLDISSSTVIFIRTGLLMLPEMVKKVLVEYLITTTSPSLAQICTSDCPFSSNNPKVQQMQSLKLANLEGFCLKIFWLHLDAADICIINFLQLLPVSESQGRLRVASLT